MTKRFTYENHKVKDNLTGEIHSSNMVSVNVLNALSDENEQLKQLVDEAEDIIVCQCTPYYQRIWENIKKNIKGDVE